MIKQIVDRALGVPEMVKIKYQVNIQNTMKFVF